MNQALTNHLLQSTIFAALAGMLTLFLHNNHARTRYWIWLTASMKFLIPFSLFIELGHRLTWQTAPIVTQPRVAFVMARISEPIFVPAPVTVATAPSIMPTLLLAIWICGVAAVLIFWFVRWRRVAGVLRMGSPMSEGRELSALRRFGTNIKLISSPAQIEPGVFGILRPVLSLPAGIANHLDDEQLDAIFAHELSHIRRRDNLTAALHMLVEAIFWFHPLVWWIGARLVEERERACDEEVVRLGSDPEIYAESILKICKLYLESPLVCAAGISGSDLKNRIETIMTNRAVFQLNFAKKAALATAGAVALAVPVLIGIVNLPGAHAQVKGATPKFEAASIKLSPGCMTVSAPASPNMPQLKGGGGPTSRTSTGRLDECRSLADLIHMAYVMYAGGVFHGVWGPQFESGPPLEGGPSWVRSDTYEIIAKPEGIPSRGVMAGPMFQALLEDRFKLKLHRDTRDVPVYELTAAKGAFKLKPSKTNCVTSQPREPGDPFQPPAAGQQPCRDMIGFRKGQNTGLEATAATLDEFCILIGHLLDRPVVNKTGIPGKFDMHLEFAVDESTPRFLAGGDLAQMAVQPSTDPAGPSVFTVVQQQLGLKLEPTKGPGEFLVIDHVERPTGN